MAKLLQQGSKGSEVEALQRDLQLLGYHLTADGIFGKGTELAVEELQWAFGYDVDAKVGDGTRALIDQQKSAGWKATEAAQLKRALETQGKRSANGALAGLALKRTLGTGAAGGDVAYLQRRLNALGWNVTVDGKFGPSTERAVRQLQQEWGYSIDGVVGPATHELINAQLGYGWRHGQPRGTQATR